MSLGQFSLNLTEGDIMYLIENERLKSFDKWPNDRDWFCTPEKLAKAGFFFKPDDDCLDNVCCGFCKKELDGWEPDDDPLAEHQKHSSKCPFLLKKTPVEDMNILDFIRLIGKVRQFQVEQVMEKMKKTIQDESKITADTIVSNVNK